MSKHIITISGNPGSGKSSTADLVAKTLGYTHYSSGIFFREAALRMGLSVEEASLTSEKQKELDFATDQYIRDLGNSKDNFVIDSRIAFHWLPQSFKVFLFLDFHISAERVFAQIQKEGRLNQSGSSVDEIYQKTIARAKSESDRYLSLYKVDMNEKNNYDLWLDTAEDDLEGVSAKILSAYEKQSH